MALPSLPPGSKYSLITNEADPSKRAIIVKLSSATLDAIDPFKHQTIDFEFGDNPVRFMMLLFSGVISHLLAHTGYTYWGQILPYALPERRYKTRAIPQN